MAGGATIPNCELFNPNKETLQLPQIEVIGGAVLGGHADFSSGLPSKCSVTKNLFGQLSPLLGSMECVVRLLKVVVALQKFAKSPLTEAAGLLSAIAELAKCFISITPLGMAASVSGMIQLVVTLLNCALEEIIAVVTLRVQLDVDRGKDDTLDEILGCATGNVDESLQGVLKTIEPIAVILELLIGLLDIAQIPTGDTIEDVKDVIELIKCPGDIDFSQVELDLSLPNPLCVPGSPLQPLCQLQDLLLGLEATITATAAFDIFGGSGNC